MSSLPCFACYRPVYSFIVGGPLDDAAGQHIRQHGTLYGRQKSPTEAAHVGLSSSRRGMSQKFPDEEAIPLCCAHHTEGPESIHGIGADAFFALHGTGRDSTIEMFNALYLEHCR